MNTINCLRGLLFCFFLLIATVGSSQIPNDLSQLKASQISNSQLQQYISQAKERGLTEDQVESELLQRGFPEGEMAELRTRIRQLNDVDSKTEPNDTPTSLDTKRKAVQEKNNPLLIPVEKAKTSKVFGMDLFTNSNLSFEPDLKMATPKNY